MRVKGLKHDFNFINKDSNNKLTVSDPYQVYGQKTRFTQDEIDEMNPDFNFDLNETKFPVEDVENDC